MSLGGGPAGSSGSGTGSTANVFTPPNQGQASSDWWSTIGPLIQQASGGGAGTPGGWAYPRAQNAWGSFLSQDSPYTYQALQGAQNAAGFANNLIAPQDLNASAYLYNQAADPAALAARSASQLEAQAPQAAQYGQGFAGEITAPIPALQQAGSTILQTAYDPQRDLYNQLQGETQDRAIAANAAAGVSGPYAAGTVNEALDKFNIDWENQQLGRQAEGLNAYGGALRGAGQLGTEGANIINQGYGTEASLLGAAGNLRNAGYGTTANLYNAASGLGNSGVNLTNAANLFPYQTGTQIGGNAISGLGNVTNLGNNQYLLPEQVLNNLQSYQKLGQSASEISGQLGNMGLQQLAGGAAGLGLATGALGDLGSLGSSLGGGSISQAFAPSLLQSAGAGADFLLPGTDTAIASVGSGAFDAGSGSAIASLLPALAS